MKWRITLLVVGLLAIVSAAVANIAPPLLPAFSSSNVGQVLQVSAGPVVTWGSVQAASGGVSGPGASTNNDLVAWSGTGGNTLIDTNIPQANVVLTSRVISAGTGLTVTNSGLLTSDITMSMSTIDNQALTVTGTLKASGALVAASGLTIGTGPTGATNANAIAFSNPGIIVSGGAQGDGLAHLTFYDSAGRCVMDISDSTSTCSQINNDLLNIAVPTRIQTGSYIDVGGSIHADNSGVTITPALTAAAASFSGIVGNARSSGATASTTQSQGAGAFSNINVFQVSVVANTNDTITLPAITTSAHHIHVKNDGANTLQIFPASGAKICMSGSACGSTNASTTIATTVAIDCYSVSSTEWSCR